MLELLFVLTELLNVRENPVATTQAAQFCSCTNITQSSSTVLFVNTSLLGAPPWMTSACTLSSKPGAHGVRHRGMACCSHRITTMTPHVLHRSPSFRCFRSLLFFVSVFCLPTHVFFMFCFVRSFWCSCCRLQMRLLLGLLCMYYQRLAFLSYFCFFAFIVLHAHSFVCNVL